MVFIVVIPDVISPYRHLRNSPKYFIIKEIPHNMGGSLTDDFQPSAACKFLDLPGARTQ